MRKNSEIIICIVFFLVNPLLGIIASTVSVLMHKSDNCLKLLMLFLMLYLSAINTTKVPYSDMISYLDMYELVPIGGFRGTIAYLSFYGTGGVKDIVYSILVYLLYYATFGNQYLFIFIITFLGYWFMFMAIYKFGKTYKLPIYILITQVLILSFFTQYFSLTFHLVRQILATSLFFYALSFRETSFKMFLLLSFFAAGIHSAIVILISFAILPVMKRRLKLFEIGYFILFAAFSVVLLSTVASFLLDTVELGDSLEGNLNRVAGMEGAEDSTAGLKMLGFFFSLMTIGLCMLERSRKRAMVYPIVVNVALVISFTILGLTASPLVQYRFFYYLYSFFPFIFPLFMRRFTIFSKLMCLMFVVLLMVRFYLTLNNIYEYLPAEDALLLPYPYLIKLV